MWGKKGGERRVWTRIKGGGEGRAWVGRREKKTGRREEGRRGHDYSPLTQT